MPYADPIKKKEAHARWSKANPGRLRSYYDNRRSRAGEIEKDRARNKKRYDANPQRESTRKAVAYRKNKPRCLARNKRWKKANPEKLRQLQARARAANPDKARRLGREYAQRRRLRPSPKIADSLRNRIYAVLKGNAKSSSTVKLLGCSFDNFKIYLESKFEGGMTWENYGTYWELDHIMPCAIFDLAKPAHQRRCFHFSNHQPLTIFKNRSKNCKVLSDQFPLL
jgi:Prasinovirus endonuclease VII